MNEMEAETKKREKEFSEWQDAYANAMAMAQSSRRPPDYYIKATIYDRDMKGGIYKVSDAPLDKGIAALLDFTETKIQNNGNEKENEERMIERRRKHRIKKGKKHHEVL